MRSHGVACTVLDLDLDLLGVPELEFKRPGPNQTGYHRVWWAPEASPSKFIPALY